MGVGAGLYMCDVVKKVHVRYLISWWVLVLTLHMQHLSGLYTEPFFRYVYKAAEALCKR